MSILAAKQGWLLAMNFIRLFFAPLLRSSANTGQKLTAPSQPLGVLLAILRLGFAPFGYVFFSRFPTGQSRGQRRDAQPPELFSSSKRARYSGPWLGGARALRPLRGGRGRKRKWTVKHGKLNRYGGGRDTFFVGRASVQSGMVANI